MSAASATIVPPMTNAAGYDSQSRNGATTLNVNSVFKGAHSRLRRNSHTDTALHNTSTAYGLASTECAISWAARARTTSASGTTAGGSVRRATGINTNSVAQPAKSAGRRSRSVSPPSPSAMARSIHMKSGGAASAKSSGPSRAEKLLPVMLTSSAASSCHTLGSRRYRRIRRQTAARTTDVVRGTTEESSADPEAVRMSGVLAGVVGHREPDGVLVGQRPPLALRSVAAAQEPLELDAAGQPPSRVGEPLPIAVDESRGAIEHIGRRRCFHRHGEHRFGKGLHSLGADDSEVECGDETIEAFRRETPVVLRVVVNGETHDGCDDEQATRLEHPVHFLYGSSDREHVLERIEAHDRAGERRIEPRLGHVVDAIDARSGPSIASDVARSRKQRPEIAQPVLLRHLERAELDNRVGRLERQDG